MAGVGLDPDLSQFPQELLDVYKTGDTAEMIVDFNSQIIDATHHYAVDYKVNANFYQGPEGRTALKQTFKYIKATNPHILRVYDGKFADVGHTSEKMAEEIFGVIDADAVLLNPYLGIDGIKPFTHWKDKLVILCVNTSNDSADEIQNLRLENGLPLWRHILNKSLSEWNEHKNIIPVLSATHPEHLVGIRDFIGQLPILLAGVGTQGGSLGESLPNCLDNEGYGALISASRAILYPKRQPSESFSDASKNAMIAFRDRINSSKKRA